MNNAGGLEQSNFGCNELTCVCGDAQVAFQLRVAVMLLHPKPKAPITAVYGGPAGASAYMTEAKPTVLIVDDDADIRESLQTLLRTVGLDSRAMESLPEFFESGLPPGPTCLILDVRLPGRSGLDLQRDLAAAHIDLPIIFITGYGDVPMSVQAMKGGAIEFLTKPYRDQELLDAIQHGLDRDRARVASERELNALRESFATLTARERQVMGYVVTGRLNKQVAADIGISEMTVKIHRGNVMRKMKAASLPQLARMADKLSEAGLFTEELQQPHPPGDPP
jgi:FixJ family two-component response regulator